MTGTQPSVGLVSSLTLVQVFTVPYPAVNVTQISVGSIHACALTSSHEVWCWGAQDAFSPHTSQTPEDYLSLLDLLVIVGPTKLDLNAGGVYPTKVVAGDRVNMVIMSDGSLRGVGITSFINTRAQLGLGDNAPVPAYQVIELVGPTTESVRVVAVPCSPVDLCCARN